MLTYNFANKGSDSLYEYLYKCIKNDIILENLDVHEKLPSKRSFAKNLGISVITVENAYEQLMAEGYIYSIPKKGFYVADLRELNLTKTHSVGPDNALLSIKEKVPYLADFTSNQTDSEIFPFTIWARTMRELLNENQQQLMENPPCGGIMALRQAIADYLHAFRGMVVNPEQIIVGAGTEYLYGLLIQLLGDDKIYGIENPGYPKIAKIYDSMHVSYSAIDLDKHGVCIDSLENHQIDIMHLSPSHHFPTGIITPISRRYELLGWASKDENRYIIEDDYDSELRLGGKPIPTLQSIDISDKVIYMNTFTKTLSSTVRISYMVLPASLTELFYKNLSFYSCTVSNFEQYTLARFMESGSFEKHINRMRKYYRNQRNAILDCIKKHPASADIQITEENAGLHFLIHFPSALSDEEIVRRAADAGIRISALSQYDHRTPAADARGTSGMHSAYDRYGRRDTRGASDTGDRDAETSAVHTLIVNYSGLRPEIIPEAADLLIRSIVIQRGDESITETQESLCRTPTGADSMPNSSADKTGFSAAENTLSDRPSKPSKGKHPVVGSLLLLLSGCISLFDFLSNGF